MPGTEIVAVPPLKALACRCSEVIEISRGARRLVLMVARRRTQERPEAPPGRLEHRLILRQGAVPILVVPQQEHGVIAASDQQVRGVPHAAGDGRAIPAVIVGVRRIAGDVPGRGDHRVGGVGGRSQGQPQRGTDRDAELHAPLIVPSGEVKSALDASRVSWTHREEPSGPTVIAKEILGDRAKRVAAYSLSSVGR